MGFRIFHVSPLTFWEAKYYMDVNLHSLMMFIFSDLWNLQATGKIVIYFLWWWLHPWIYCPYPTTELCNSLPKSNYFLLILCAWGLKFSLLAHCVCLKWKEITWKFNDNAEYKGTCTHIWENISNIYKKSSSSYKF